MCVISLPKARYTIPSVYNGIFFATVLYIPAGSNYLILEKPQQQQQKFSPSLCSTTEVYVPRRYVPGPVYSNIRPKKFCGLFETEKECVVCLCRILKVCYTIIYMI